jgi:hypothetical protein
MEGCVFQVVPWFLVGAAPLSHLSSRARLPARIEDSVREPRTLFDVIVSQLPSLLATVDLRRCEKTTCSSGSVRCRWGRTRSCDCGVVRFGSAFLCISFFFVEV